MAGKRSRQAYEADLQKQQSPFVVYGTPLPPIDENTRDDGSYVPVWKQEVTDDRGRKRLHGAFTGGFSAGYFNTVGSKEGWTPSTFVSSRQNRIKDADRPKVQPEDLMDEEDLREAEESRQISTSEGYQGFGSTENDSVRLGGLMDIMRTKGGTIGVKLLKKMGWKEGQGIGPKVKRTATVDDADGKSDETYLFAPENPPMISFTRKSDYKGVGYAGDVGLERGADPGVHKDRPDTSNHASDDEYSPSNALQFGNTKQKPRKPVPKSSFGVGVLNDTGSDDEDPYEMGPKISYNKVIGADKKAKKKKILAIGSANPLLKDKPVFVSKKMSNTAAKTGFRKCHDGKLPLDGFVLTNDLDSFSSLKLQESKFTPPEVPDDWKSLKAPDGISQDAPYVSSKEAARNSTLDAQSRANILGESQLPGKSVFDFLTPAARERISLATGKKNLPEARSEGVLVGSDFSDNQNNQSLQDLVPLLEASVAIQALERGAAGWMPYSDDEPKRQRYCSYLEIRAGVRPAPELPPRAPKASQDDWVIEMQEFARAAQVFKPVSGLMASRFTSSSSTLPNTQQQAGETGLASETEQLLTRPAAKPEDPAEAAAKMGMFGPLTRSVHNWYPNRLLCKRFNVPVPENMDRSSTSASTSAQAAAALADMGGRMQFAAPQAGSVSLSGLASSSISDASLAPQLGGKEMLKLEAAAGTSLTPQEPPVIDPGRNEALEQERPGEAIFKAIFGQSDDEDDD